MEITRVFHCNARCDGIITAVPRIISLLVITSWRSMRMTSHESHGLSDQRQIDCWFYTFSEWQQRRHQRSCNEQDLHRKECPSFVCWRCFFFFFCCCCCCCCFLGGDFLFLFLGRGALLCYIYWFETCLRLLVIGSIRALTIHTHYFFILKALLYPSVDHNIRYSRHLHQWSCLAHFVVCWVYK